MLGGINREQMSKGIAYIRQTLGAFGKRLLDGLSRWWDRGIWYRLALFAVIPVLAICACCSGFTVFAFLHKGRRGWPNRTQLLPHKQRELTLQLPAMRFYILLLRPLRYYQRLLLAHNQLQLLPLPLFRPQQRLQDQPRLPLLSGRLSTPLPATGFLTLQRSLLAMRNGE